MSRRDRGNSGEREGPHDHRAGRTIDRRTLLAAVGTGAVAVAGCLGGGDGGDGSDGDGGASGATATATPTDVHTATDTPTATMEQDTATATETDPGTTTSGDSSSISCGPLTSGYHRYDESESPFVATFEIPGDVSATGTVNNNHGLTVRVDLGDRQPFDFFPAQLLQGTDSLTPAQKGEVDGLEVVGQVTFDGEQVPLVRASPSNADDEVRYYQQYPYYLAGLPYEGSSGTKYYRMYVQGTVQFADGVEAPACQDAFEEAARHLLSSLEPNPDTTVESEGT